jgi:hypothetical protein
VGICHCDPVQYVAGAWGILYHIWNCDEIG